MNGKFEQLRRFLQRILAVLVKKGGNDSMFHHPLWAVDTMYIPGSILYIYIYIHKHLLQGVICHSGPFPRTKNIH